MHTPKYKRIILKLSGEALAAENGFGIDPTLLQRVATAIIKTAKLGVQIGIIVGGGNIWRGRAGVGMDRSTADYMGMLATCINALALQDALEQQGLQTRVQTAIEMRQIAEPYIKRKAIRHLEKGRIVVFACGTGNPYFSTDTAAALRAAEIQADAIMLAKNVDGIYDSDPRTNPQARRFEQISYKEVIQRGLAAMDTTAITLCMENNIPVMVFALSEPDNIYNAVTGDIRGTMVGQ